VSPHAVGFTPTARPLPDSKARRVDPRSAEPGPIAVGGIPASAPRCGLEKELPGKRAREQDQVAAILARFRSSTFEHVRRYARVHSETDCPRCLSP
jgi:hypothetical protein